MKTIFKTMDGDFEFEWLNKVFFSKGMILVREEAELIVDEVVININEQVRYIHLLRS